MTRQIIERLFLFALPFIIYGGYVLLGRMRPLPSPERHPWNILAIIGVALFAASFLVWGLTEGEPTTGQYVPPHVVNGKVVPGYVERQEK
ncbi:MAG TPA: DUF6111 family protein [Rhizomicrobium sp.]|nr:DUF6111 family protein [Rhizomicrobium sp.]